MGDIFSWPLSLAMKAFSFFVLAAFLFLIAGLAAWIRDARPPEEKLVVFVIWAGLAAVSFFGFLIFGLGLSGSAGVVVGASLWGFFWKQIISFFFGKEPLSL
ncbi:MAG: hypothetical protein AAB584_01760 [Patescibacteria group bacterium]